MWGLLARIIMIVFKTSLQRSDCPVKARPGQCQAKVWAKHAVKQCHMHQSPHRKGLHAGFYNLDSAYAWYRKAFGHQWDPWIWAAHPCPGLQKGLQETSGYHQAHGLGVIIVRHTAARAASLIGGALHRRRLALH